MFLLPKVVGIIEDYKEMNEEFQRRADKAAEAYWNARVLPRKAKKFARKIAIIDVQFYTLLIEVNKKNIGF